MRISELIRSIREPPPESLVGFMTRFEGRFMRNMPFFILINLAWVFLWPLLAGQPFLRVILPTLLSVPVFIYLHLCTYFYGGPARVRLRYVLGELLLGYAVAPVNLSALGYLIFGFFGLSFTLSLRRAALTIGAAIALYV